MFGAFQRAFIEARVGFCQFHAGFDGSFIVGLGLVLHGSGLPGHTGLPHLSFTQLDVLAIQVPDCVPVTTLPRPVSLVPANRGHDVPGLTGFGDFERGLLVLGQRGQIRWTGERGQTHFGICPQLRRKDRVGRCRL